MTHSSASAKNQSRCSYRSATGRRCRQPVQNADLGTCHKHADPHFSARIATNFHSILTRDSEEFTTARGIHSSLSELYRLLAEDQIPTRRASVLAYITQLMIRILPMALAEAHPDSAEDPARIAVDFGDLPRPNRADPTPIQPESSRPS